MMPVCREPMFLSINTLTHGTTGTVLQLRKSAVLTTDECVVAVAGVELANHKACNDTRLVSLE